MLLIPGSQLMYVRAGSAGGLFSQIEFCISTALLDPKRGIIRLAHRIALTPKHVEYRTAQASQSLEVTKFDVAWLRQVVQAQTALYCIAHAQTGQHCRNDANDMPDLQGQPTFFKSVVFNLSNYKVQLSRSYCAALQHDFINICA